MSTVDLGASAPRLAFVSHVLPPGWSGQAMVIARLASCIPPERVLFLSQRGAGQGGRADDGIERVFLPRELGQRLASRVDILGAMSAPYRLRLRAWRIARALAGARCRVAVAGTGDLIDLPATARACARLGIPFVAYLFDDFAGQWGLAPRTQRWARAQERQFIAAAAAVIVPNEALAGEIRSRYGIEATVIRNPALGGTGPAGESLPHWNAAAPSIVYTGAVYHVNYGAFRTLIAALEMLSDPRPRLDIYSAQEPADLRREGVFGPTVRLHAHVEPGEAARLQRAADLLFMGFSFGTDLPEIARTSAPGKLGDYLASGRPILALAPSDSFLANYLRDNECGLVVDKDDPRRLASAVERLLYEPGLAERLAANALARATAEFAPAVAAARFLRVVDEAVLAPGAPARHR